MHDDEQRMSALRAGRLSALFLGFLALVAGGFVLYVLREMLLAVVLALLFSLIFKPIMIFLRRKGVPAPLAILVVVLCFLGIFGFLGFIMFTGVESLVEAAPLYQTRLNEILQQGTKVIESAMRRIGRGGQKVNWAETLQISSVAAFVAASVGSVLSFFENVVLVLLFLIFLLSGSEDFPDKVSRAFTTQQSLRVNDVIAQINTQVRRYIVVKTLVNVAVGALTTLIMILFDVDFPLLIGLVTFFLNYIPNFGALIATIFPIAVALLQFDSLGLPVIIAVLLVIIHNLIGNFVEPKVLGKSLDLSPLLVLLALIFWGWLWGLLGMVLAVPITSIIKIICENIGPLKPLAVLMSSRIPEE